MNTIQELTINKIPDEDCYSFKIEAASSLKGLGYISIEAVHSNKFRRLVSSIASVNEISSFIKEVVEEKFPEGYGSLEEDGILELGSFDAAIVIALDISKALDEEEVLALFTKACDADRKEGEWTLLKKL